MKNMFRFFNLTDIFPMLGGASGSFIAVFEKTPDLSFKAVLIYIVMTVLGAVIGYLVKTILDIAGLKKYIARLKKQLEQLNRKK